jgi:hypothetical protein
VPAPKQANMNHTPPGAKVAGEVAAGEVTGAAEAHRALAVELGARGGPALAGRALAVAHRIEDAGLETGGCAKQLVG